MYTQADVENFIPWERDIFTAMYVEDLNKKNKELQSQ
jgi:hypothetical protein